MLPTVSLILYGNCYRCFSRAAWRSDSYFWRATFFSSIKLAIQAFASRSKLTGPDRKTPCIEELDKSALIARSSASRPDAENTPATAALVDAISPSEQCHEVAPA